MNRPNLQSRVVALDNAKDHGKWRLLPPRATIWHETDGGTAKSTMDFLNSIAKEASYHYIIERDGTIYRFLDPGFIGWHAGKKAFSTNPEVQSLIRGEGVNNFTIGVSFANMVFGEKLTYKQLESGLWLGQVLQQRYDYPARMNFGHKEVVEKGYKSDPHELDMDRWRELLGMSEWPEDLASAHCIT